MIKPTKYKLKDIAEVSAGDSAPSKDDFSLDGIPFIRASSLAFLTNGESIEKCEKIDRQLATKNKLRLFPKHSVIFAKSGMSAKMGRVYELPTDSFVVNHLAVLQTNANLINSSFLKYYFSYKPPFHLIRDDAYPSIKLSDIRLIEIDLPDIITQNKIVSVLDKVNSLIKKRVDSIEILNNLLNATFLHMFGEPYQNSKKWETKAIGLVISDIKTGWSANGEQRERNENEFGVLKISSVTSGEFRSGEHKAVAQNQVKRKIITPIKGDLLFSRANTFDLVGATCIVDKDYPRLFLPDKLWKIEVNNELVKSEYLKSVLSSPIFRKNLARTATGSSGSMLNISQQKFRMVRLPIPPIAEQKKYTSIFWKIFHLKEKKKLILGDLLILSKSISQKAFNGKLNFDIEIELDGLIREIDLLKKDNDLSKIIGDVSYLQRLVDKLNGQEFKDRDLYDKAKHGVFQLMAVEEENKRIIQEYDSINKSLRLTLR